MTKQKRTNKKEVGTQVVAEVDKNLMALCYDFDDFTVSMAVVEVLSYMYGIEPEMEEFS